jgi:hypothetical protein
LIEPLRAFSFNRPIALGYSLPRGVAGVDASMPTITTTAAARNWLVLIFVFGPAMRQYGKRNPLADPAPLRRPRSRAPRPVPTLGELHREPYWCWIYCERCAHGRQIALAPYIIRWGANVSNDMLRRNGPCQEGGHRGAELRHASYHTPDIHYHPFAIDHVVKGIAGKVALPPES